MIADVNAESPYERAEGVLTRQALHDALATLGYRERLVIELRYGLGDREPHTLDQIARRFGVNRDRIRQIENRSLIKLRRLRAAQALRNGPESAVEVASRAW